MSSLSSTVNACMKRDSERGGGKEGERQTGRGEEGEGERERENRHMKPCSINLASCLLCPSPRAMIAAHNLLKDGGEWFMSHLVNQTPNN